MNFRAADRGFDMPVRFGTFRSQRGCSVHTLAL